MQSSEIQQLNALRVMHQFVPYIIVYTVQLGKQGKQARILSICQIYISRLPFPSLTNVCHYRNTLAIYPMIEQYLQILRYDNHYLITKLLKINAFEMHCRYHQSIKCISDIFDGIHQYSRVQFCYPIYLIIPYRQLCTGNKLTYNA